MWINIYKRVDLPYGSILISLWNAYIVGQKDDLTSSIHLILRERGRVNDERFN